MTPLPNVPGFRLPDPSLLGLLISHGHQDHWGLIQLLVYVPLRQRTQVMIREIENAGCLDGAAAVWSMWPGYLEQPGQARLLQFLETNGIPLVTHHASGHAYLPDLQRLARAVAPTRLVPIHSFAPARFGEFFEHVEVHRDGEWWGV